MRARDSRQLRATPCLTAAAAVAVAVAALAGCSGGSAGPGAATTADSAPPAAGSTATTATDTTTTTTTTTTAAAARTVTSMTSFRSPTKNISCYLAPVEGTSPYARCDLAEGVTWTEPEPDAGCPGDWGGAGGSGSVGLGGGPAQVLCVTDTTVDPGAQELPYGSSITLGDLTCTSLETGMQCDNAATGHGFTVSKRAFDRR